MNSEKDTVPNNEAILNAVKEMQSEMNTKFTDLHNEINTKIEGLQSEMNVKIEGLQSEMNVRFEDMRLQMMSFDVRIDRIEALTHEVLNVAYNSRADVKVLREKVHGWSKEVQDLQLRVA